MTTETKMVRRVSEVVTELRSCLEDVLLDQGSCLVSEDGTEHMTSAAGMRLWHACVVVDLAAELLRSAGAEMHDHGATWDEVAAVLGISRQSAHERFSNVVRR